MKNSKIIKSNNSLFVISNTNNLTNNLASSIILPVAASPKCLNAENSAETNVIYAYETFNTNQTYFSEKYRESDNSFPVVIELDISILEFFEPKLKLKTVKENNVEFFLLPFVPIYFIKKIHFNSKKDYEDFMDVRYSNFDKDSLIGIANPLSIDIKISEDYFNGNDSIVFLNRYEPEIPISQINTLDSLLGGIQLLMYMAKKEPSSAKTKKYITLIENLVNHDKNSLITEVFDFDILKTINKGISSISSSDVLDIKIFKACLIKLVSEAYQDINFGDELIEEIIDMIPGSLLSDKENQEIEDFLIFIDDISSGKKSLPNNIFKPTKKQSLIKTSLILLMTQVGKREFLDITDMYLNDMLDENIFISSILLFGLFRNYSGLDNAFKKESNLKNLSLLASPLLSDFISDEKINKSLKKSPNLKSKWWELSFNGIELVSIEMDDPFYTSIIAQAAEAGFHFEEEKEDEYVYKPLLSKNNPRLYMEKGAENFFRIKTEAILKKSALNKLTKQNFLNILALANDLKFRSSIAIANDGSLILKHDQLSSTLDIPEIETMINSLVKDYSLLKQELQS